MRKEKSCGALIFRKSDNGTEMLLIKNRRGGHWAFPKGHVEEGESEVQTALREVKEETGLSVKLVDGFKEQVQYNPSPFIQKKVVYFMGLADKDDEVVRQEEEVSEAKWISLQKVHHMLTFHNDKILVSKASKILEEKTEK